MISTGKQISDPFLLFQQISSVNTGLFVENDLSVPPPFWTRAHVVGIENRMQASLTALLLSVAPYL